MTSEKQQSDDQEASAEPPYSHDGSKLLGLAKQCPCPENDNCEKGEDCDRQDRDEWDQDDPEHAKSHATDHPCQVASKYPLDDHPQFGRQVHPDMVRPPVARST